jgi:regulator of cell morphogenesis and NO signaling
MKGLTERKVGELVRQNPGWARVFEKYDIDYCCGGDVSLRRAAEQQGISPAEVVEDLETAETDADHLMDWSDKDIEKIVDHIVESHHEYLREELPRLKGLSEKVANAHGDSHPELFDIRDVVEELVSELKSHIDKEESDVFPVIVDGNAEDSELLAALSELKSEHRQTSKAISELKDLTNGFEPPEGACNSYRAFYQGLRELDRDIKLHVHEENNVLFPRAQMLAD